MLCSPYVFENLYFYIRNSKFDNIGFAIIVDHIVHISDFLCIFIDKIEFDSLTVLLLLLFNLFARTRPRRRPDWSEMMKEVESGRKLKHVVCNDRYAHGIIIIMP